MREGFYVINACIGCRFNASYIMLNIKKMKIQANTSNRNRNKIMKAAVKLKKSPDLTKMYKIKVKKPGIPLTDYFFRTKERRDRFIKKHTFDYLKIY